MSKYIIQTEPESLDDYKEVVRQRSGKSEVNMSLVYLLQDYNVKHGDLKGMNFDKVLDIMLEDRL